MEHELHHQSATFEKINATLDRIAEKQEKAALEMEEMTYTFPCFFIISKE